MQAIVSPNHFSDLGTDWDWDGETLTKANGFLYQLQSSVFIICFAILLEILSSFRGLTKKLQMEAVGVIYAYKEVNEIIRSLNSMRSNSSSEFHKVYMRAMRIGTSFMEMAFHLQSQELLVNKFTGTMSRLLLWKIITEYRCTMNLFLMWSVRWRLDLLLMKIIVLGYSIYC